MASTYSPLKIELITTGEQSATWGTTTNINLGTAIEEAITGSADVTFASANVTLTLTNTNGSQTARNLRLRLTGTTAGARSLIVPGIEKQYIVKNDTADTITIRNVTGSGVAIPTTMSAIVYNDGVNVTSASVYSTSVVTSLLAATDASFVNALPVASGGTGVTTSTGTGAVVRATSPTLITADLGTPTSGILTNCTGLPLSTGTTGILGVSNGGTGVTTSTGSGANVLASGPTLVSPILGTPTSGTLTSCTGLPLTTGVTGTLAVSNGGTGVTSSTGSGANVLSTSPTLVTPVLGTPSSGSLVSCTGLPLSTGVTGTLGVSNGGTGVTTVTGTGSNVLSASPTLVTPILGTPTSGALDNCTGLPLSTGVTGTLGVSNGGTGVTTVTGTGSNVLSASPTLVTPNLGTPSTLVGTNISGSSTSFAANVVGGGAGQIPYNTGSNTTAFLAAGSAGQVLQSNGTSAPSWVNNYPIVSMTVQNATSFNVDFTPIPATAKRITMMLSGVSIASGTTPLLIQLGDSGGLETTGYVGVTSQIAGTVASSAQTTGLQLTTTNSTAYLINAQITCTLLNSSTNTWSMSGTGSTASGAVLTFLANCTKSLTATLDRVRLTSVANAATFNAGTVSVMYE